METFGTASPVAIVCLHLLNTYFSRSNFEKDMKGINGNKTSKLKIDVSEEHNGTMTRTRYMAMLAYFTQL